MEELTKIEQALAAKILLRRKKSPERKKTQNLQKERVCLCIL